MVFACQHREGFAIQAVAASPTWTTRAIVMRNKGYMTERAEALDDKCHSYLYLSLQFVPGAGAARLMFLRQRRRFGPSCCAGTAHRSDKSKVLLERLGT